jgi:hypothetical protein
VASRNFRPGKVKRLQRELLLVREVAIDPALLNPGFLHNLPQGTAFVTSLIEERRGLRNDALPRLVPFARRLDRIIDHAGASLRDDCLSTDDK